MLKPNHEEGVKHSEGLPASRKRAFNGESVSKVYAVFVLSRALLPWDGVRTCCFWRSLCPSAVTLHYFWPPSPLEPWLSTRLLNQLSKAQQRRTSLQLFFQFQHVRHKHIKSTLISWSVNVPGHLNVIKSPFCGPKHQKEVWNSQLSSFIPPRRLPVTIRLSSSCQDLQTFSASNPVYTPSVLSTPTEHQSYNDPIQLFLGEGLPHLCILIRLFIFLHGRIFSLWRTWHDPQKHNQWEHILL